jgi:hypothetical protein
VQHYFTSHTRNSLTTEEEYKLPKMMADMDGQSCRVESPVGYRTEQNTEQKHRVFSFRLYPHNYEYGVFTVTYLKKLGTKIDWTLKRRFASPAARCCLVLHKLS